MSLAANIRKLRDKADKLRLKGQSQKALGVYRELVKMDPETARWPHQAGEILKMQKMKDEAVGMFLEAANRYVAQGFGIQAVVLAKVILDLDPEQPQAHELLQRLSESRQHQVARWASPTSPQAPSEGEPQQRTMRQEPGSGGRQNPPSVEVPSAEAFSLGVSSPSPSVRAPALELDLEPSPSHGSPGRYTKARSAKQVGSSAGAAPKPPPIPPQLGGGRSARGPKKAGPPPFPGDLGGQATGRDPGSPRRGSPHHPSPQMRRPETIEINLKSGETLDGLSLREVVGSSGEYSPVDSEEKFGGGAGIRRRGGGDRHRVGRFGSEAPTGHGRDRFHLSASFSSIERCHSSCRGS